MPGIRQVIGRIMELEESREKAGEALRQYRDREIDSEVVLEKFLAKSIEEKQLDGFSAAGVDGGFVKKEFQGVDVVLTRASAAVFSYGSGSLVNYQYLPEGLNRPDVRYIESPLDRREFNVSSSMMRLQKEIEIAIEVLDRDPDILLLDGSIIPQYTDRPEKGSFSRKLYDELIEKYTELFRKADEKDIMLAGVIEDSRSQRMSEELSRQEFVDQEFEDVLKNTKDTSVLGYVLDRGQRTSVMKYTKEYQKHMVLRDLGEYGEKVHNFYLRTAENDFPVRIDFLGNGNLSEDADRISSSILPLCSYSSNYGIPSVIVEADRRASLDQEDIKRFESQLTSAMGPMFGSRNLRRNNRPF